MGPETRQLLPHIRARARAVRGGVFGAARCWETVLVPRWGYIVKLITVILHGVFYHYTKNVKLYPARTQCRLEFTIWAFG